MVETVERNMEADERYEFIQVCSRQLGCQMNTADHPDWLTGSI